MSGWDIYAVADGLLWARQAHRAVSIKISSPLTVGHRLQTTVWFTGFVLPPGVRVMVFNVHFPSGATS